MSVPPLNTHFRKRATTSPARARSITATATSGASGTTTRSSTRRRPAAGRRRERRRRRHPLRPGRCATTKTCPTTTPSSYCLEQLSKKHDKPFFLACGLHKPHMPWNVPQKYYDMFPLDTIELPPVLENDLDDVPAGGRADGQARRRPRRDARSPAAGRKRCRATWRPSRSATRWSAGC